MLSGCKAYALLVFKYLEKSKAAAVREYHLNDLGLG